MRWMPGMLALLTGVAGWFYLFYSRAAYGLAAHEGERLNRQRVRLRRVGGVVMLLLSVAFYLGFYAADPQLHPKVFIWVWLAVFVLLAAIVLLALVDVRLTLRLKSRRSQPHDADLAPPP